MSAKYAADFPQFADVRAGIRRMGCEIPKERVGGSQNYKTAALNEGLSTGRGLQALVGFLVADVLRNQCYVKYMAKPDIPNLA